MFTDVVGSTALKNDERFGKDKIQRDRKYKESVQIPHYQRVAKYVLEQSGEIVNTAGDSFFAVFESPVAALRSVVAAFRSLKADPIFTAPDSSLELYAGLHYGEIEEFDRSTLGLGRDYQGTEVDKAARVQGCAGRGQILVSEAIQILVGEIRDIEIRFVGNYFLKGLGHSRLWDVDWNRSGAARKTRVPPVEPDFDLPPFVDPFIGRLHELDELRSLLRAHQSVFLQGLTGVGKTSMLVHYALSELRTGQLADHGFFYFDCAARDLRIPAAADLLLDYLARFLGRVGATDSLVAIIASNQRSLRDRANAVAMALASTACLVLLDNFQSTLDSTLSLVSRPLGEFLTYVLQRQTGESRILFASYERWSPPDRCPVYHHTLQELNADDTTALLAATGLTDSRLVERARGVVGGHPQALQWFARLAADEAVEIGDVITALASVRRDRYTEAEFHRRLSTELLDRIHNQLSFEARHLLIAAAIYRRPPSYVAICAAAEILAPDEPVTRRARRELLGYFLLNAERFEGPYVVHLLVREYALSVLRQMPQRQVTFHNAAAEWWLSLMPNGIEAGPGIERHYHLREAGRTADAAELQSQLAELLRNAGRDARESGFLEDALNYNQWLLEHGADPAYSYFYLAQTFRDLRRHSEAEYHFRAALDLRPENPVFLTAFASFLAGKPGHDRETERLFLKAIHLAPKMSRVRSSYASFLIRRQQWGEAEAQFRQILDFEPENIRAIYSLGSLLKRWGRTDEAEIELRRGLLIQPDNPWIASALAAMLVHRKAFAEAEKHLLTVLDRWPKNPWVRTELARFYARRPGREKEVEAHFRAGLLGAPWDPVLHNEFARWLASHGAFQEAEYHFREAVGVAPHNPHPRNSFARFLIEVDRLEEAEAQLRAGLAAQPDNPELANAMAGLLVKAGRDEEALQAFEEALAKHPSAYSLLTSFGDFLRKTDRHPERAEKLLREAARLAPDQPQAVLLLGKLLEHKGNSTEAEMVFRSGLFENREHVPIFDALAKLLASQGRFAAAEDIFLQALKLDRRNSRVRHSYVSFILLPQERLAAACQQVLAGLRWSPTHHGLLNKLKRIRSAGFDCK